MSPLRLEGLPRFAARAALASVVAAATAAALRTAWGTAFRAVGNLAAAGVGTGGRVQLVPLAPARFLSADTAALLFAPGKEGGVRFELSSVRFGLVPIAVFVSLSWAARWRRERLGPFLWGLAAAAAWGLVSVAISVARVSLRTPSLDFPAPAALVTAVELAYRTLVNPPAFEYVVPAFLWLVLAVRSGGEVDREGGARRRQLVTIPSR
jgi:hypothetical protein